MAITSIIEVTKYFLRLNKEHLPFCGRSRPGKVWY